MSHFMSELIVKALQYISTTSGFITFISVITAAYAGIWFLFLFEAMPKRKKAKSTEEAPAEEDAAKKKGEAAKAPAKQSGKAAAAGKA
ncbi:hypothetical protein LLH00_19155 [bacterium]|nr:hypothetical protein [bacterium]